ncbi:MAG: hypothetical protein JNL38_08995, partial [Myxococcales bacterium]|nr:hypothetical protein [Myxococcales bacterium]
ANSGTMSGPFQAIDCDAFALWNSDPTGNCYQSVGGEGCGVYVNPLDGHWNTAGGTDIDGEKWTDNANYVIGQRVLPTVGQRSGYQYVVTTGGAVPPFAAEPNWPTVIGDFVDQNGVRFTCWMHEGGTVRTDNGGICAFGHIHGEEEKPGADFATAAVLMSANKEHTLTLGSSVYFGMSKGAVLPLTVTSRGQELWETKPEQVLSVAIGSGPSTPYVAYQFNASLRDYYKNGGDVSVPDEGYIQRFFTDKDEEFARWREQWGSLSTFGLSYSQCGGASLPQAGAMCFANYWLGAQLGLEARHSAINPTGSATSDGPYYPNILDGTNWERAFGAWGPGDIVWNLCGQAEGPLSRWPVAWRFRRYAARRFDATAWATSTDYVAGTLIKPATNNPNGYVFQAMFAATTTDNAGDEPDWSAAAIGSTFTEVNVAAGKRPQKWRCVGTEINLDSGMAGLYEPMLTQAPTMTVVDLSSVAVATIELTPEQAAYERIKLVRTDPEQGATLVKLPRGAGDGWLKFFWNASGTELLLQMIDGGATVLMPAANPNGAHVASDGVDLLKST